MTLFGSAGQRFARAAVGLLALGKLAAAYRVTPNARPDTLDFRDQVYETTLIEVPSGASGGVAIVAEHIRRLAASGVELHIAAHSAGSILMAPMVELITSGGARVKTCTLWAPAATMQVYDEHYHPAILEGRITAFALYTLTDKKERDDNCKKIYNKSLLYLVAHACERQERIPLFSLTARPRLEWRSTWRNTAH